MAVKKINSLGEIVISNEVIAKISGMAATRCYGVVGMTDPKGKLYNLLLGDSITKGVSISTKDESLVIDLHIMVEYGVNISAISESIIKNVKYSVESMTGCMVGGVNVFVDSTRVDQ